ncbi:phosphopantetheine-binding protein [Pantoea agglomerans]|uniref:phosphopantetheine-binding protein n=1 Tax=Enterobacter agglomerans TaxID=549 RepID=UPI00289924A2|nr:phosphopantetheine-binding protein [Pantoea agglomerans]WNK36099.1 phosphopantetheine-binding protein [Pantoea agglomerans]
MQNLDSAQLCEIVKESIIDVLEIEKINEKDDFFNIGGCSLTALDVIDKIHEKTGKKIPLRDFLQEPTPIALTAFLNRVQ